LQSGKDIVIRNLPSGIKEKIDVLTGAYRQTYVVGKRADSVIMRKVVPPYTKRTDPEYGFWIWELPKKWFDENGEVHTDKDAIHGRIYQPVGNEDRLVISCSANKDRNDANVPCTVYTELDTGAESSCERISLEYGMFANELQNWRTIDSIVRQKVHVLVHSPPIRFKKIDG